MSPYGPEVIEACFRLYLKYNGQNYAAIEREMHQLGWPDWHSQNLYSRGKGEKRKQGWIEKYGWEAQLEAHRKNSATATLNSAQRLVREVETVREQLYRLINAQGGTVDKEKLQLHRDYCNLHIAALTKVEASRDTLGAFVDNMERLIDWLPDIDIKAARALLKVWQQVVDRAEREFGETQEQVESLSMNGNQDSGIADADDRAEAGEAQGGRRSGASEDRTARGR